MKKTALFASLLCLAQSTLHAEVPLFINYQGKVADATGLPIGATGTAAAPVAAPTNRKVIFRIFDASTGGTRLWTEEQTATISLGVFSVLLGNGIDPTGTANSETRPALDTIFTPSAASSRFLEIMVDNGDNVINESDKPISPRQQITSTAFALHAKVADGIASSTDLAINPLTGTATNYGLGWYGTGRLFGGVAVDGPVLYGNAGGALGSNVGGTQKLALAWNTAGQVGIGATSSYDTNNKLTLQGDDSVTPARQLTIRGNTDTTKRLNIGYDTTANKATLQSYTAASTTAPLLLNPSGGNVGVNNTAPSVALDVTGAIKASTSIAAGAGGVISSGGIQSSNNIVAGTSISANGNSGHTFYGTGDTDGGLFSPADGTVTLKTNNTERVRVDPLGNVGVNNTAPSVALDVTGAIKASTTISATSLIVANSGLSPIYLCNNDTLAGTWIRNDGHTNFSTSSGDMYFGLYGNAKSLRFYNGGTHVMNVNENGNVGIGTTHTPTQAKLVVSGYVSSSVPTGYAYQSNGQTYAGGPYPRNVSIYSSNSIWASELIIVSSDKRIKNISGVSDGAADLGTLMGIEVTNYIYKDVISKGNSEQKKLIAQQVETVFPQAVSKRTDAVPDIYQKAALNDGWVQLATDLKKGERVKLIGGKEEGVHEVLEVGDGKFRTDFKSADAGLFVYGREVNDFRTVDYDAIAMLNVSATQQVKREKDAELQTLRDENAALRRELAAKDASLETRLMALERRMSGDGATETVSLKTAQAVK